MRAGGERKEEQEGRGGLRGGREIMEELRERNCFKEGE